MKKIISALCLVISSIVFAQDKMTFSDVFSSNYKSVALIEEGFYLKSSDLKNPELFKRLETLMSVKIVDHYYCYAKGSAFVVSSEGYLITNFHVLSYTSVDDKKKWLYWKFINDMINDLPPGYFSRAEMRKMVFEFEKLLDKAEFTTVVKFYDQTCVVPEVLINEAGSDIALIKATLPEGIKPLVLSSSAPPAAGQEVAALGYPLQNLLDNFLKDFKPTFSTGIISATRNDEWGIQHTASINPGNSGGPLMNLDGKVVGVNVGTVNNASNMFFAIPIEKCITIMKDHGYNSFTAE